MFIPYESVAQSIETAAVVVLCLGLAYSTLRFLIGAARRQMDSIVPRFRRELGRTLQLALEILIAADIIETVIVDRTLASMGMLGALVLIRTFLSFSLELEITGRWPWQDRPAANADDS